MRKKAFALALATALTLGSAVPVLATYDNGTEAAGEQSFDEEEGFDDEDGVYGEGEVEGEEYGSPENVTPTKNPGDGDLSEPPIDDTDLTLTPPPATGTMPPPTDSVTSQTPKATLTPTSRSTITPRATTPPGTSPKTGQVDYLLFGTLGAAACASVVVVSKKKNDKK